MFRELFEGFTKDNDWLLYDKQLRYEEIYASTQVSAFVTINGIIVSYGDPRALQTKETSKLKEVNTFIKTLNKKHGSTIPPVPKFQHDRLKG
jgi:hypothetical protein